VRFAALLAALLPMLVSFPAKAAPELYPLIHAIGTIDVALLASDGVSSAAAYESLDLSPVATGEILAERVGILNPAWAVSTWTLLTQPVTYSGSFGVAAIPFTITIDSTTVWNTDFTAIAGGTIDVSDANVVMAVQGTLTVPGQEIPFNLQRTTEVQVRATATPETISLQLLFGPVMPRSGSAIPIGSADGIDYSLAYFRPNLSNGYPTLTYAPEPASGALLAAGVFVLAAMRRRPRARRG